MTPFFFKKNKVISGGGSFTPASIAGLSLWLDASQVSSIIKVGAAVLQWNDLSSNGNNYTQLTALAQPTYSSVGGGQIHFDGSATYLMNGTTNLSLGGGCSLVIVMSDSYSQGGRIWSYQANGEGNDYAGPASFSLRDNFGGRVEIGHNNTFNDINLSGMPCLYIVTFDNTNQKQYMNGSLINTWADNGILGNNGASYLANDSINDYGEVDLMEVILYNAALTSAQVTSLHTYAQSKWGTP